jgi:hypothetical protein
VPSPSRRAPRPLRSRARGATLAISLALSLALFPEANARAQSATDSATAETLFNEALSLLEKEQPAEACPKLEESQRLDPGIGTLLYLADCYRQLGRTASAWATFRDAAYLAKDRSDEREELAQEHAAALEAQLSYLKLEVTPQPGVQLVLMHDDKTVGQALWGTAFPTDPGEHRLRAEAPGKETWSQTLTIVEGPHETTVVVPVLADLPPEPLPVPVAPRPAKVVPAPARSRALPIAGWSLIGIGSAALLTSGILALLAKGDDGDADALCRPDRTDLCDPLGVDLSESAHSKATWAGVSAGLGLLAVGGGVTLLLLSPSETNPLNVAELSFEAKLLAGGSGLSLRGAW